MPLTLPCCSLAALSLVLLTLSPTALARDESKPADKPTNWDDHVGPILRRRCAACHGEGKQEAGLNLASYSAAIKGSGGGEVVVAGRASSSRLIQVLTSTEDGERMPPNADPLPPESIALITRWIETGLRENAGSSAASMRTLGFKPAGTTTDAGPGPVPKDLPPVTRTPTLRPFPVLALASSPRAPVLAVSGFKVIDLLDPATRSTLGAIPFPDGEPLVLTFSRSGRLLLAAGGKPVQNGSAVLFDVASGKSVASVADEPDAIIAADLAPDEKQVAIGCTSRLVKLYSTEDGSLKVTLDKHTDWVTAVAFSPDGKYLATADRIGNIHLWDGQTGGVILPLSEHKKSVRALSWRSDSAVVASCGEDGTVVWWDVKDGWPLATKPNAHKDGVLDCRFGPQGELVTCGRDGTVRLWTANGQELKAIPLTTSQPATTSLSPGVRLFPTRVSIAADGKTIVAGDTSGQLHTWPLP
ncbi:MAG: c-type cytochrome domain-containing protein [Planctomycetota bacterium]